MNFKTFSTAVTAIALAGALSACGNKAEEANSEAADANAAVADYNSAVADANMAAADANAASADANAAGNMTPDVNGEVSTSPM